MMNSTKFNKTKACGMGKNQIFITHPMPKNDQNAGVDQEAKFVQFLR